MSNKCMMCGAINAKEVEEGLVLCEKCEAVRQANLAPKEEKVIDVDFKEAETTENEKEKELKMKAVIICGIAEDDSIVFDLNGTDANFMTLKGLAEYANRRVDQMIDRKEYELAMAAQQAMMEEQAKKEEANGEKEAE